MIVYITRISPNNLTKVNTTTLMNLIKGKIRAKAEELQFKIRMNPNFIMCYHGINQMEINITCLLGQDPLKENLITYNSMGLNLKNP